MLKDWVHENRKDLLFIVFCWFGISIVMFTQTWESISNLDLKDNDDYMRYVQFMDWIKNGNWYLEPISRFNPENGVLIHWSRVPDFLLAGITLALTPYLGLVLSSHVAISVVPLFYMLCFALAVFAFVDHYLGKEFRFIGMIFVLGSHAITKFFPGSIDHHNVQLIIVALFLAISPLNDSQVRSRVRFVIQSLLIALSMWIGLDNFLLFTIYIGVYSFYCLFIKHSWFNYFGCLCLGVSLFGTIFALLNRPLNEFCTPYYDSLSIPFIGCFVSGGILLLIISKLPIENKPNNIKMLVVIPIALFVFIPLIIIFPELVQGAYANYPTLLTEYWLGNVIEAQSMLSLIQSKGLISTSNFILFFIPSLCYPLFKNRTVQLDIIYIILLLYLLISFFWQIRTITTCFVISAPLQAYVLYNLSIKTKSTLMSVFSLIIGIPFVIIILITSLDILRGEKNDSEPETNENASSVYSIFNEYEISKSKILSGIETGTTILAKTNNSIVAAPYHRNIYGNTLSINTFLESDDKEIINSLIENKIEYILINKDNQLEYLYYSSDEDSLIKRLKSGTPPEWLELINDKSTQSYKLFRFKGNYE
ncbi:hypothetical protein A6E01_02870 [Vibrio breoganii]|uniref:Uncharacterized protein n=1 Tax=Vibrio breoganii TaxID=553239 RepID=A0AAN0XT80_9VIBR|nr:hypothetical protein [Vibrio breoganii]ANO32215.1 hypothetical protein A6E01_02870 [Vibrio breoganii]PMO33286.1 hypothetical protein BCT12_15980 [Vibrio breoganii]